MYCKKNQNKSLGSLSNRWLKSPTTFTYKNHKQTRALRQINIKSLRGHHPSIDLFVALATLCYWPNPHPPSSSSSIISPRETDYTCLRLLPCLFIRRPTCTFCLCVYNSQSSSETVTARFCSSRGSHFFKSTTTRLVSKENRRASATILCEIYKLYIKREGYED